MLLVHNESVNLFFNGFSFLSSGVFSYLKHQTSRQITLTPVKTLSLSFTVSDT